MGVKRRFCVIARLLGLSNLKFSQQRDCHTRLSYGVLTDWPAPKKINGFRIAMFEIATVACGSFAMTLLVHFLLHTSWESGQVLTMTQNGQNSTYYPPNGYSFLRWFLKMCQAAHIFSNLKQAAFLQLPILTIILIKN